MPYPMVSRPRFRAGHLVAYCWSLFFLQFLGCGPTAYRVEVDTSGAMDEVVSLSVSASFNGQTASSTVTHDLDHFALRLLSASTDPGLLDLTISAIGIDGCQRSLAHTQVILPTDQPIAVTLTPKRGCKVVIRKNGSGQGQVSPPDGSFTCKFDGAPPIDPACTTDVPGACAVCRPLGSLLTLEAFPEEKTIPRAYFAGWTGVCSGRDSCSVAINSGELTVGVGLQPIQVCNVDGFCWENPMPQGNSLNGIWSASADDVWFVGEGGIILHWNGLFLAPFSSGTTQTLQAVWGSGSNDVWAIGNVADTIHSLYSTTILHYDGSAWSPVTSFPEIFITSLWGSGPTDVWAVGYTYVSSLGVILHYDGNSWSTFANVDAQYLWGVWGSGPRDVWAISNRHNTILHYDGSAWSPVANLPQTFDTLSGLWGSGPNDVWVLSSTGNILHYNGTSWTLFTKVNVSTVNTPSGYFAGLGGSGPNDVWAFGSTGFMMHFDGSSWLLYRNDSASEKLNAIWVGGPGDAWSAGNSIIHLTGALWSHQGQDQQTSRGNLNDIWGSGPRDIWTVGAPGQILHYNGTAWLPAFNLQENLYGVWGSGPSDVWAVGYKSNDVILHYNGAAWTSIVPRPGLLALSCVWGSKPNDIWVGSTAGGILHYTGTTWDTVAGPNRVIKLWGSGPNDIWALDSNAIWHYNGTWNKVNGLPAGVNNFYGLWGSGPNDVWVVGDRGILHYGQAGWVRMYSSPIDTYTGVWGSGPDDVWVVGRDGVLLHWDGTSVKVRQSGTALHLEAVWGSQPGDAIVVGGAAAILHHYP